MQTRFRLRLWRREIRNSPGKTLVVPRFTMARIVNAADGRHDACAVEQAA
jgi:hypothetical protein